MKTINELARINKKMHKNLLKKQASIILHFNFNRILDPDPRTSAGMNFQFLIIYFIKRCICNIRSYYIH